MVHQSSDEIPAATLSEYLGDNVLRTVASDDRTSVYAYECGCVAAREVGSEHCYVRWCDTHRAAC